MPGLKNLIDLVKIVGKVDVKDLKKLVDAAAYVNRLIEPAMPVIKDAAVNAAGNAVKLGKDAGVAVNGAVKNAKDAAKEKRIIKKHEKELNEIRKLAIDTAITSTTAKSFMELYDKYSASNIKSEIYNISGCYAFLKLPNSQTKDLLKYEEVYVGSSENIGRALRNDLTGNGNIDIYADFKYKQKLVILVYPCDKEDIQKMYESLVMNLQAFNSYNALQLCVADES